MKSKPSPTLKASALILVCAAVLAACELVETRDLMQQQIGKPLSELISQWGFPTDERREHGRDLVFWTRTDVSYENTPKLDVTVPLTDNIEFSGSFPLGEGEELACSRIVEVDSDQIVINASVQGNDCPRYAPSSW